MSYKNKLNLKLKSLLKKSNILNVVYSDGSKQLIEN